MPLSRISNNQIATNAAISHDKMGAMTTSHLPSGSVLQVQTTNVKPSLTSTQSTSFVDIGVSCTITPASTSSKILVFRTLGFYIYGGAADTNFNSLLLRNVGGGSYTILNSGRLANTTSGAYIYAHYEAGGGSELADYQHFTYVDTPNTTSACIYKIQGCLGNAGGTVNFNLSNDSYANITLLEVKG